MLILAGVTIAAISGDNGILQNAVRAKEETEETNDEELRRLTALEAATNIKGTVYEDNSRNESVYEKVKIPAGFAVSQIEGENTIADGLVIIDQKGNEFVWVPVDYNKEEDNFSTEFVRRAGYYEGSLQALFSKCGEADGNSETGDNTNGGVTESETTKKEAKEMYASVKENGGFYIGRYEAGKDKNGNVIVQKGVDVYNNVPWSKTLEMYEDVKTTNTQEGAIELARDFDAKNGYTNLTSTLCYGVQWDAVMKFVDGIENQNVIGNLPYIQNSIGMGWYNDNSGGIPHQTGTDVSENRSNCVKNIYDLAGNVEEWTMESCYTYRRVSRGGTYKNTGSDYPASIRLNVGTDGSNSAIGFRITLYL